MGGHLHKMTECHERIKIAMTNQIVYVRISIICGGYKMLAWLSSESRPLYLGLRGNVLGKHIVSAQYHDF